MPINLFFYCYDSVLKKYHIVYSESILCVASSRLLSDMAASNNDVFHIPLIDLSNDTTRIGDLLVDSVSKWGFVFIRSVGSGFTPEVVDRAFEMVRSRLRS